MKENINYFSLVDIKHHLKDDELNDNVLIYDFDIENDNRTVPSIPGRANAIGIVICHEGHIALNINAQEFTLTAGMATLILPKCIYNVHSGSTHARGTIFAVSIELMKEMHIDIQHIVPLGMHMFHNPCFHISEHNVELFNHYLDMIRLVSNKKANHSVKVIQGLISSMLAFTHEVMEQEVGNAGTAKGERINNRNMRLFEEFMTLLTENFRSEHQIGFYADKLCLTPKYLSLLIKQTSGRSVSDWIDYCIIMEAKSLLRYSDLSIQQVAYTLHFPTPSFFGTYFKRHVGMTPGDFRQGDEKLMGE